MSRTVQAIAVFVSLLVIYIVFIAPLSEKRAVLKDKLYSEYKTLERYEEFIGNTQKAEDELRNALKDLEKLEINIIHESDVSLGSARLQARIQDLAQAADLKVTSIKPLQILDSKWYRGLPIYLDGTGDINQLSEFLRLLDSGGDLISIERINVGTAVKDNLRIKMQLLGLMRK